MSGGTAGKFRDRDGVASLGMVVLVARTTLPASRRAVDGRVALMDAIAGNADDPLHDEGVLVLRREKHYRCRLRWILAIGHQWALPAGSEARQKKRKTSRWTKTFLADQQRSS